MKQILNKEGLVGISKVVRRGDLYMLFTDGSFAIISGDDIESIERTTGDYGLVDLGIISEEEYNSFINKRFECIERSEFERLTKKYGSEQLK